MNNLPNDIIFLIGKNLNKKDLYSFLLISKNFSKTFKINLITKEYFKKTFEIHKVDYYLKKSCGYIFKQQKECKKKPRDAMLLYCLTDESVHNRIELFRGHELFETVVIMGKNIKIYDIYDLVGDLYSRDPNKLFEIFILLNKYINLKYNNPKYNDFLLNNVFRRVKGFINFNKGMKTKIQGIGIVDIVDDLNYLSNL